MKENRDFQVVFGSNSSGFARVSPWLVVKSRDFSVDYPEVGLAGVTVAVQFPRELRLRGHDDHRRVQPSRVKKHHGGVHRAGETGMKNTKKAGFTLIEVLIAVFILSVVLLAISSMVYSVMRSTSNSKETSTATTLMQDEMETLKNAGSLRA